MPASPGGRRRNRQRTRASTSDLAASRGRATSSRATPGSGITVDSRSGPASHTLIEGNRIGVNASGDAPLANGRGIDLSVEAVYTEVRGNVISGNTDVGVSIFDQHNLLMGNHIGTDLSGSLPLGNGGSGVMVEGSVLGSDNVIGGSAPGTGNTIAYNHLAGVTIYADPLYGAPLRDRVVGNAIFANGGLGIDLNGDGVSTNDPGDADAGANGLQNAPLPADAWSDATTTTFERHPRQPALGDLQPRCLQQHELRPERPRRGPDVPRLEHRDGRRQRQRRLQRDLRRRHRGRSLPHRHRHHRRRLHLGVLDLRRGASIPHPARL